MCFLSISSLFFFKVGSKFNVDCLVQELVANCRRQQVHAIKYNWLGNAVAVYLDDICLAADNFEEMLPRVKALFNRIRAAGFLLKAKKCDLFQETVQYLGYTISKKGIELSKNKVERIKHWQAPTSLSELRNFVGFINFYQTHLKDFAKLCQPFYRLFRKNVPFNWTPECQEF